MAGPTLLELEREKLWRDCARDIQTRALEHERCRRDVVHWVKWWVMTFDPRLPPGERILPFEPYPKQVELLRWLVERHDTRTSGVICKGRDTGVTWLCVAFALHRWLFQDGYVGIFGSRRENLVDKLGDMDAILPKARFILQRLPVWMLPKGFRIDKHANAMQIMNPANGSMLKGESGDEMGRGGRAASFFIDEAA